jgi:plasmid stability protein
MASVVVRNLSAEAKARLVARAERRHHSLEAELRDILEAVARTEAESPDVQEAMGSWIVRVTRPGYADVADTIEAYRQQPDRPLPSFD